MASTIYKEIRKEQGISREAAAEALGISIDKLEKIENGKQRPNSFDVNDMITYYKSPELRNYFCMNNCALGEKYLNKISPMDLPEIAIKLFNSINNSYDIEDVLLRISDDGRITEDELEAVVLLQRDFNKLRDIIESFNVYIEEKKLKGDIDSVKYDTLKSKLDE